MMHFSVHVCAWSWVVFDGPQFTDNMYVLEEGEYPNPEAMGLLNSDCKISSLHSVGHVSTGKMTGVPRLVRLILNLVRLKMRLWGCARQETVTCSIRRGLSCNNKLLSLVMYMYFWPLPTFRFKHETFIWLKEMWICCNNKNNSLGNNIYNEFEKRKKSTICYRKV